MLLTNQTEEKSRDFSLLEKAISDSKFSERISFLLKNPEIGYETVQIRGEAYREHSNCWGTAVFIVGAVKDFLCAWRNMVIKDKEVIEVRDKRMPDACYFLINDSRPGYIGLRYMEWFLKERCILSKTEEPDNIVATYGTLYDGKGCSIRSGLLHAGVFIRNINGNPMIIEQKGNGRIFKLEELNKYSQSFRNKIEFYSYNA